MRFQTNVANDEFGYHDQKQQTDQNNLVTIETNMMCNNSIL